MKKTNSMNDDVLPKMITRSEMKKNDKKNLGNKKPEAKNTPKKK